MQSPEISASHEAPKSRSGMLIVSVLLVLGLAAFAFYLSFSKTAIQDQQKQLDADNTSLHAQIDQLKSQNIEGQQSAQAWLDQLQKSEIRWSRVIKTVQDLVPTDTLTQKARVQFLSYSGSAGGKLTLNAQTLPGSGDAFADVSTLLSVFNSSSFFKDAYVPSMSHSINQSGQDYMTFVFNVTYDEQFPTGKTNSDSQPSVTPLTVTPGSSSQQVDTSTSTVKVPRNK